MAIGTRLLGTYTGAPSGTSVPVPLSSAPVSGEYVQVLVCYTYDGGYVGTADGFTLTGDNSAGKPMYVPYLQVFGRFAGSGEAASVTLGKGAAAKSYGVVVLAHTSVDKTSPLAAGPTFASGGQASGNAPAISPGAAGKVLWLAGHQNYRAAADSDVVWTAGGEIGQAVSDFNLLSVAGADSDGSAAAARAWTVSPWGGNTDAATAAMALREAVATPAPSGPEPGRALLAYA